MAATPASLQKPPELAPTANPAEFNMGTVGNVANEIKIDQLTQYIGYK